VDISSHPYIKFKWFPSEIRNVATEFFVEEARKVEDPKNVNEADRTDRASYFSADEYFDNNGEATNADNSENFKLYENSVKVEVVYVVDRRLLKYLVLVLK